MTARTILVVDDDPHIRDVIKFALEKAGMQTLLAKDGADALRQFERSDADLVVLDINMPELDGLEVCKAIRKSSDVPVLFLSSRDEEVDRIIGLEIGGDDYVTKPFSPRELLARVKVILKRSRATAAPQPDGDVLSHGHVVLDANRHLVTWAGEPVQLTATEFAILEGFLKRPEHVLDRNNIIDRAYGLTVHVSDRTVDSHIRHIRQKFEQHGCEQLIETVHGVGYKLGACK